MFFDEHVGAGQYEFRLETTAEGKIQLVFFVPDETPLKIIYTIRINVLGLVTLSNKVTIPDPYFENSSHVQDNSQLRMAIATANINSNIFTKNYGNFFDLFWLILKASSPSKLSKIRKIIFSLF